MNFAEVVGRSWSENRLFTVYLELTYRCNLDCFFCYNDLGLRGKPLARAQYISLLEDLRDLNVLSLTLTGGEPLAHPDFMLLGAKARELGFVVRIKSNGHALRGEVARRVRDEIDPFIVEVSLHGSTAMTHDRQTRVPGSFERLLENVREMLGLGLRVKINSTLTLWNEAEVGAMYEIADNLGVQLQFDPRVTPRDDGSSEPLAVAPTDDGVLNLYRYLLRREAVVGGEPNGRPALIDDEAMPSSPGKSCGAGSSGIAIDPYGNIYPCVQWRRAVGSLHEASIKEIWERSAGLSAVREATSDAQEMLSAHGQRAQYFAFCAGFAELATGSPLTIPAVMEQRAVAIETVLEERKG